MLHRLVSGAAIVAALLAAACATSPPPISRAKFESLHGKSRPRLELKYDEATETTSITLHHDVYVVLGKKEPSPTVTFLFGAKMATLALALPSSQGSRPRRCKALTFLVDGEEWPPRPVKRSVRAGRGGPATELFATHVSLDGLRKIAQAKRVEWSLCSDDGEFTDAEIELVGQMVQKIAAYKPPPPPEPIAPQLEERPEPDPPKKVAKTPAAPAATSQIGIKECDDYLAKFKACLSGKVPQAAQDAMDRALEKVLEAWRKAAATEAGRKALAQACPRALEAAKKALAGYGCQW